MCIKKDKFTVEKIARFKTAEKKDWQYFTESFGKKSTESQYRLNETINSHFLFNYAKKIIRIVHHTIILNPGFRTHSEYLIPQYYRSPEIVTNDLSDSTNN